MAAEGAIPELNCVPSRWRTLFLSFSGWGVVIFPRACRSRVSLSVQSLRCGKLSTWVRRTVHFPQRRNGDLRVNLRRLNRGVPQEFLDITHARPAFQQVRRKGMSQGMRGDLLLKVRACRRALNDLPRGLARQGFAPLVEEKSALSPAS